jgi:hypothetical protein
MSQNRQLKLRSNNSKYENPSEVIQWKDGLDGFLIIEKGASAIQEALIRTFLNLPWYRPADE